MGSASAPWTPPGSYASNKPYSKLKNCIPGNSVPTNFLILGAVFLQRLLKVAAEEGHVYPILTQIVPNLLNHSTITKGMYDWLTECVAEGALSVKKHTPSIEAFLHPDDIVITETHKRLDHRKHLRLPYPLTPKWINIILINGYLINWSEVETTMILLLPSQLVLSTGYHSNRNGLKFLLGWIWKIKVSNRLVPPISWHHIFYLQVHKLIRKRALKPQGWTSCHTKS